jgi:hypothetical protein
LDDGTAQWYSGKAAINNDINPAHILRECYTNQRWGLSHPSSAFNDDVWTPFADQLYTEGFGLSCLWEGDQTLEEFILDILRHINAVIYQEPRTAEFVPKLIRDDYVVGELETFSTESIIRIEEFGRSSLGMVPDQVYVEYWDIFNNKKTIVPDHDPSILDLQGKSISETFEFPFITQGVLAQKVAARERAAISSLVSNLTIVGTRRMAHLRPGDVFLLDWPALGITQMVVRILEADYGTLQEGNIRLECSEDIWATQAAIYSTPVSSAWVSPTSTPTEPTEVVCLELPFYSLILEWGLTPILELDVGAGYLAIAAAAPTGDSYDYELLVRDTALGDFTAEGYFDWTPSGRLVAALPKNAVEATVSLSSTYNLIAVDSGSYALVDDELCLVKSANPALNQVTLARGVLDTVPETHAINARVWFIGSLVSIVSRLYSDSAEPAVKLLTRTGLGQLDEGDASANLSDSFNSRQVRPYPPGNFQINGSSYPTSFSGQPTISWSHRDRTAQTTIVEHSAGNIGPEAGTTYTLRIYNQSDVLVRTEPGLTGTSYTYLEADERSDCGLGPADPLNTSLRFELWSVRDGYSSWQQYDLTVNRT